MKRSIIYLLLLALLFSSACKKFLNGAQPTSFVQPSAFYQTDAQVLSALYGVYSPLTDNAFDNGAGGDLYSWFLNTQAQYVSDEMGQAFSGVLNALPSLYPGANYNDPYVTGYWQGCYNGINRANTLLAAAINPAIDTTGYIQEILAEARFLRGYYYFLLVQDFGGVPLRLTPTTYPTPLAVPRATTAATYAQVKSDMESALPYLYPINNANLGGGSSRISYTAAEGILARVCLYMAGAAPIGLGDQSEYDSAKSYAEAVINSGLHSLTTSQDTVSNLVNVPRGTPVFYDRNLINTNGNPSYHNNGYAQNFIYEAQGQYNLRENMWEADYAYGSSTSFKTGAIGYRFGQNVNDVTLGSGGGNWLVNPYLYVSYIDSNDLRRDWNICPYSLITPTTAVPTGKQFTYKGANGNFAAAQIGNRSQGKWRIEIQPNYNAPTNKISSFIKFPILRYADVLLMAAEAEYMTGDIADALNHVNWVRRRAYGWDNYTSPPGNVGQYQYCDIPNAAVDYVSGQSYATFNLGTIQAERRRELCFEDLRIEDLKRWGAGGSFYQATLQAVVNYGNTRTDQGSINNSQANVLSVGVAKALLWPIPYNEMNVNTAIVQNPGW